MKTQIVGSLALLVASTLTQAAANPPSITTLPLDEIMSNLDRNQNGCIEEEEGRNYTSRRFHLLDANGDSQLDSNEAPPAPEDTTAVRPISVEAWQDAYHVRFTALDADASGCLSPAEITDGRARLGSPN